MGARLYVGNLGSGTNENDLSNLFNHAGLVLFTTVPVDERTGSLRNYGFVSMGTIEAAQAAIRSLNGHDMRGNPISIRMAEENEK